MITEDYVSFETAKLLKAKEFDDVSAIMYKENGEICINPKSVVSWRLKYWYPCLTLQMAMKWLREVHGLHISLEPYYDYDSMHVVFLAFVQNIADVHEFMDGRKNVATHPNAEKSYELAIKHCLEHLI